MKSTHWLQLSLPVHDLTRKKGTSNKKIIDHPDAMACMGTVKKNCQSCTSDFKSVNKIIANIRFQSEQVGFLLVQVDTCGDFNTSSDLIGHTVHNIKVDFFFL